MYIHVVSYEGDSSEDQNRYWKLKYVDSLKVTVMIL
jgi:hypothetical protein